MNLQVRTNLALTENWWALLFSIHILFTYTCNSQSDFPWRDNPQYERLGFAAGYISTGLPLDIQEDLDSACEVSRWLRTEINWEHVQPEIIDHDDSIFHWERSDSAIIPARNRGMNILAIIGFSPSWAWPHELQNDNFINNVRGSYFFHPAPRRDCIQDWKVFCAKAAQRYSNDSIGVHYYEIGNEQNSQYFYMNKYNNMQLDAITYPELLRAAVDTIRAVDPLAFIVTGGLAPSPTDVISDTTLFGVTVHNDIMSVKSWLDSLYASPGQDIRTYYNALGYHPYAFPDDSDPSIDPEYDVRMYGGPLYIGPYPIQDPGPYPAESRFLFSENIRRIMCLAGDTLTEFQGQTIPKLLWGTEYGRGVGNGVSIGQPQVLMQAAWVDDYISKWISWEFTGPLMFYNIRDYQHASLDSSEWEYNGVFDYYHNRRPSYLELKKWGLGYINGEIEIFDGKSLERWAPDLDSATVILMSDIVLDEPARFGSGHRVVIKSATSNSPKTITGCLALNDCSLTLENVNIEQPVNYAFRDSSFIGFSNISLSENSRLYIRGLNSRVHVDGQIAGTPDSLWIENADLSNSHDVAFMRIGGGDITLKKCAMNDAESFGDLSTFRFANSNVYFRDFTCVGGISDSSTVELLNSNAVFENSRILTNSSLFGVGGVYFKSLENHVLTLRGLELRDNETVDQTRPSNAFVRGGDLDTHDPRGASFVCESLGCTSNAPQVMIDLSDRPILTTYAIENCTFRGGSAIISTVDNDHTSDQCLIRNVIIDNCHVTANRAGGTLEHVTITSTGHLDTDTTVPFTARRSILLCDTNGLVLPADGHNWTSSQGDPYLAASGEPRWDSPCLDQLDDELGEFDLTPGDLGAKAYRVMQNLQGWIVDSLAIGNYEIVNNTVVDGYIAPGSVLRVASGKVLHIREFSDGDFTRKLGDLNSPRTTIVGRPTPDANPARAITIQNWYNDDIDRLIMDGVLFNYAPRDGNDANLYLKNWWPAWCEGPQIDGENVKFMYYTNAPMPDGSTYDGGLLLVNCTGAVRNLDFGQASGPAWLQLNDCRTDVDHNTFEPQGDVPCLTVVGIQTGETPSLTDNTFTVVNGQSAPMLDASGGLMNLRRNQFLDCLTTPISLHSSSLHADQEARNDVRADLVDFTESQPLVDLEGGYLNLFCGRNNFVVRNRNEDWPIISWIPHQLDSTALMTWRENFWGISCQGGISEAELNNRSLALIPPWATVEDNLSECVEVTTPANPLCPFETSTPSELLANGKAAEILGNFSLAQDNYRALLWLWAAKKEVNEGTLRLKALGLHKEYGPEAYELVRDDLFTAADSSQVVMLSYQEVLQRCSGWCVEARWGDRPLAIQSLNTMLALAIDQVIRDIIKRALLEIATYPPQGGLQALDDEALFAQALAQQAATAALMNYQSGQDVHVAGVVELPKTFEIARLYPNPFNATVTLELAFPADGQARVRVFNLLGQVVQTVLDQRVIAGVRKSTLDASGWSSGLYFLVAEHEGAVQVRKMTLLK